MVRITMSAAADQPGWTRITITEHLPTNILKAHEWSWLLRRNHKAKVTEAKNDTGFDNQEPMSYHQPLIRELLHYAERDWSESNSEPIIDLEAP